MGKIDAKRTPAEAQQTLTQRRAAAKARAKASIELLQRLAERHRHQMAVDALDRLILTGKTFRFDTLADLLLPQPWVLDEEGRIAGHVLTVDDDRLLQASDQDTFEVLALPEALTQPWADVEARVLWGRAYAEALRALADQADGATRAAQEAHALRALLTKP